MRRLKRNLADCGTGYIIFGVWTVIKIFLTLTMNHPFIEQLLDDINTELDMPVDADPETVQFLVNLFLFIVFFIIAAVAFFIHLYIGSSAISFSNGKKKRKIFLFFCGCLIAANLFTIPSYFRYDDVYAETSGDKGLVPAIVDISMCFLLFEIIYSVTRIDRLRKEGTQG